MPDADTHTSAFLRPSFAHSGGFPAQIAFDGGATLDFAFDQNYWIDAVGGSALALDLGTNELGNITSLADVTPANARSFEYDTLSRLTDVDDGNAALIEAFSYDATGNRLSKQTTSGTQSYGYAPTNHRLASIDATARSYDAMGSLTSRGDGWTFEYDARQRLSLAKLNGTTRQNNTYNGKGERVGAGRGAGFLRKDYTYLYDEAGRLLAEYRMIPFQNLPPVLEREYVWLGDRPVAILVHDGAYAGEILHVHSDHLGTPRAVTRPDAGNAVVWRWDLRGTAFGEHAAIEDPDGDSVAFSLNLRYPGQYLDAETGLHYNYFRDYEAGTGRYVESDPIGLWGGLSTYGYVHQSPLTSFDVNGKAASRLAYELAGEAARDFVLGGYNCVVAAAFAEGSARAESEAAGLGTDPTGALRHCIWLCKIKKTMGERCAAVAGWSHEVTGRNLGASMDDTRMDFANNRQGMLCADESGKSCQQSCNERLLRCQLSGMGGGATCFN